MKQGYVIIRETRDVKGRKRFYVVVKAANGKTLMISEGLNSKASARKNIVAANNAFVGKKWINLI